MVVIDDDHNGFRHLILPIACADELVMDAVLAVSAFHLSGTAGSQEFADPTRPYTRAIRRLQERKYLSEYDLSTKQFLFVTIIVLLVGVTITGCSDFPIVFQLLESALDVIGGESGLGDGELSEFLIRQIHKYDALYVYPCCFLVSAEELIFPRWRVYAAPLLSQDAGVQSILSGAQQSFDCLEYYRSLHPEHSSTFSLIAHLRQQAYDIYLQRALIGHMDSNTSTERIERFKVMIESFPNDAPGEQCLIWASFIFGSESCTAEHRLFFQNYLEKHYRRNGFLNIPKALGLLKRIWAREAHENWTTLLPEPQVFIM